MTIFQYLTVLEVGQLVPDGLYLVQLLLVVHHDDVGPAVLGHVPHGVHAVGGVDAGAEAAGRYGGQRADVPLGRVEPDDVHSVVGLQAQLDERLGNSFNILLRFRRSSCFYFYFILFLILFILFIL